MLLENGIPERVLEHLLHMAELGALSLVPLPAREITSFFCPRARLTSLPRVPDTEIQSNDVGNIWVTSRYTWGRKLLADGTSTPYIPVQGLPYRPIPPHLGGQTPPHDPFGPYGKYPLAHYYPTAERARQWMEWRAMERARLGLEPRPDPTPFQAVP